MIGSEQNHKYYEVARDHITLARPKADNGESEHYLILSGKGFARIDEYARRQHQ